MVSKQLFSEDLEMNVNDIPGNSCRLTYNLSKNNKTYLYWAWL